jgi:hypothetical protein
MTAVAGERWCPECGDEFRAGFDTCPDCKVALVDALPVIVELPKPTPSDHDQLEYDLALWSVDEREALTFLLRSGEVPFEWTTATTLVAPNARRSMIDDLLGYIEGESEQWRADDDDAATAMSRPVGQPPRYDGAHWIDETSGWATFRADLRTAIRAWKVAPAIPIVTMTLVAVQRALGIVSRDIDWVFLAIAAISLATIGFPGAQRVWYLRAFRGDVLDAAEVWPITRAFFGRFFVLGLATLVVTVPAALVSLAISGDGRIACFVATSFLLDIVLTFVTPALAYTTRSVGEAVRIGIGTIGREWPRSTWYVLTPGIAGSALVWIVPADLFGDGGSIAVAIGAALLALWFKGAIAAFYLRRHPETGDTGAAYPERFSDW